VSALGKRYARALLELAAANDSLEPTGEELGRVMAAFEEPRLRPLVLSPVIDAGARLRNAKAVVDALRVSPYVRNLTALLAERDRLTILPDVVRWYETLLDARLGRARVTIRSAAALGANEKTELIELARRLTDCKAVIATTDVDPELLGGVVLDVGGTVYDGSVRTQLARLSKEMAEGGA
jgi:F-type H+-transporting ATPase subunit delta